MKSQRGRWVCWKSKNTSLKSGLIPNIYTRYLICLMRVLMMLLSIRYNVRACHSPVYHITATAVYLIQRFITACVVVMWSQSFYLSRMNSQCVHSVCCKSTSTRLKERFEIKYSWCRQTYTRYHICLMRVLIILLSIRYNVCACHSPVYHYITATAVCCLPHTYCLCSGLCTANHILAYQYEYVQGHCSSLETNASVLGWGSHERIICGAVSYNVL